MLSKYNRKEKIVKHYAVNACLMPVCAVHGLAVTTVEVNFKNNKEKTIYEEKSF